jgi:cell division protein FtsI (penicillin-binding protein 3)
MSRSKHRITSTWRRRLVLGLFTVSALTLVARAGYLQLIDREFLQTQGEARHIRSVQVPANRGMLLDRNGEALAASAPVDSVWAEPMILLADPAGLARLAGALGATVPELERRLRGREDRQFVYLKRHVSPKVAYAVKLLGVPGVNLRREYHRYYPTAEVTGQLLGYTNIDDEGQEGLELAYDDWLRGRPGAKRVLRDRFGRTIKDVASIRVPQPGRDVVLSIDRRIQYLAYRQLKAAVLQHKAKSAAAVVLDVRTGEILAMVSQPAGNPNRGSDRRAALQRNRVVTDVFEPGSTFKPLAVAAALESGKVSSRSQIDTSPGELRVGGQTVRDVRDFGVLDVSGVLRKSSNVGVSKLALALPDDALWSLYQRLGFGVSVGLGFPGEAPGHLSHYSEWNRFERATHAFGYGVSVSVLHLARAYAALAADGVMYPASLLRVEHPGPGQRVLSADTARAVRTMLEAVVGPDGTAQRAQVSAYRVAGKTGTARKNARDGGYEDDRFLAMFAGMAPASNPRLVMAVMIDDPRGEEYYGGQVAAPVFSQVMSGALRLMNVPPDDLPEELDLMRVADRSERL